MNNRNASDQRLARRGVRQRTVMALGLLVAVFVALALDAVGLRRDHAFNHAVEEKRLSEAASHDSAHGRLATARLLHLAGDVNAAVAAYGEVFRDDGERLWRDARYNLATLYLEQAQALSTSNSMRVPLIELAKQLLRELLRVDPDDWDARYNLSRALEALPDPDLSDQQEDENPERAPRAPRANPAYERLP